MGFGDDIIGSSLARGAAARGKRIAFGDGRRIIWSNTSPEIFQGNPNIAPPGCERRPDVEWIAFYRGCRIYSYADDKRWVWNYEFRVQPGQLFFQRTIVPIDDDVILIEPNVAGQKSSAANRQWPVERYQQVADQLRAEGYRIVQPDYPGATFKLRGAALKKLTFRENLDLLRQVALYIGPHGGLSHGAAAVGTPAAIIFGGWAPPQTLGYDLHANLNGGGDACGSLYPCRHCTAALDAITVDQVVAQAGRLLHGDV